MCYSAAVPKTLAIFAVFLAITQASVPIIGQAPNSPASDGQKQNDGRENNEQPSRAAPRVVRQDESGRKQRTESNKRPSDDQQAAINIADSAPVSELWSWHDKVAWGAGLLLLTVAAVTLWWFVVQTNATKKAAEAALLNVKALVISERPWLVVDIKSQIERFAFVHTLSFINQGRTPAELVEVHCACELHPVAGFTPPENLNCPLTHPTRTLFFADDPVKIYDVPEGMLSPANRTGEDPRTVYVYGRIRYWDKFTDRTVLGVEPYLTQWCFHYIPGTKETSERFFLTPNGYNKHT
jgi:hypothetical protein